MIVNQNNEKVLCALIAKIINDLNILSAPPGGAELGEAVQRLGYLIQRVGGLELGLKFEWLSRGPYSRELQRYYPCVALMLANSASDYSNIEAKYRDVLNKVKDFIRRVREVFGALTLRELELVTSAIMLCLEVYPKPADPVRELAERKRIRLNEASEALRLAKSLGLGCG